MVAVVIGLIAALIWLSKGSGYTDAELDNANVALKTHKDIDAKIKKIDVELANTSRDDKLRARKYRD
jgi:hypothetical protein